MKRLIIYLISIISLVFNFNCGSKDVLKPEAWQGKYGLKPNTGVFAAKINFEEKRWKDHKMIYFLNNESKNATISFDTISSSGYILMKNLPVGKYFVEASFELYYFRKNLLEYDLSSYSLSAGYCDNYYINIYTDSITYIEYSAPGRPRQPTPTVDSMYPADPKDECELKQIRFNLIEENYCNFLNFKRKN